MESAKRRLGSILACCLLFFAISSGCVSQREKSQAATLQPGALISREPVVLFCDINSITTDSEVAGLSLALSSLIRRDLFCVKKLSVIPTDETQVSSKSFFMGKKGLRRIGVDYGADVVIVGLLAAQTDTVSIELQALDLASDSLVLKTKVNGKRTSLLSTEEKLIEQIVKALDVNLAADEREKIDSHNPKSYDELAGYGLGLVYEKKGKFTDALVSYQGSVRGQEAAIVLAAEARAYKRLNSPEKALKCYETAVERDPHFAEGWYRLNLYEAQLNHKDDRALECCLKALEIAPRFGKARLSLGTRLHDLGRLDEAIAETNVAAAVLRVDPIPSYNLGLYYLESGDRVSARAWFQRSLLINPRFELARLELQKLAPR